MIEVIRKVYDYIRSRRGDYQLTFPRNSPSAQRVLQDLAKFCRANDTVYHEDQRLTDVLIGRQEVFRRIQNHLNLSSEDLYRLATGKQLDLTGDDTQ